MATFTQDDNGKWILEKSVKGGLKCYNDMIEKTFKRLYPLFEKAQQLNEFEFILTLTGFAPNDGTMWDPLKNLKEVYEGFDRIKRKFKYDGPLVEHNSLFLYGLIIECSAPYEIIASLLNILDGNWQGYNNFPDQPNQNGKLTPQHPQVKIDTLIRRAKKHHVKLDFFENLVDSKLRNSIFHSDYTIGANSEIILVKYDINGHPQKMVYDKDQILTITNRAIAYYETFMAVLNIFISSYKTPKVIKTTHRVKCPNATTIIRKGYGVIGVVDTYSKKEIEMGAEPFLWWRYHKYETKLLDKENPVLPFDRIELINKFLRVLPQRIRKYPISWVQGLIE